jgi:hypothetical protein
MTLHDLSPLSGLSGSGPTGIRVYDPALCCSSGVCGPEPDAELIRFAADVAWLEARGIGVQRFNLGQEPGAFAAEPLVRKALGTQGLGCLPMVVADGKVLAEGRYPSREEVLALHG